MLGTRIGSLAYHLAAHTKLHVIALVPEPKHTDAFEDV